MRVIGVIPARFGSSRFPGKPLALILGKPLLQWTIEGAKTSKLISKLIVATDDIRIADLAKKIGVEAVMTDSQLPTGTDRVRAALKGQEAEVVLNIQGDEPLLSGELLDRLILPFQKDATLEMATLGRPLTEESLQSIHTAKIVLNQFDDALYFSRLPIPFTRTNMAANESDPFVLKHVGLYAFRRSFLDNFCAAGPCKLELSESLEQLRALYLGARIRVVRTDADSWGVDTPDDVRKIEEMLTSRNK